MKLQANDKLVMIGDSITDSGRARPVGEGLFDAIGKNGYVSYVDALLSARYPERAVRVVNMGTGGNTVRDLKARWRTDALDQRPDWLSVMIGINDVWRQFDVPRQREQHVGLDEYRATLDDLLARARPSVKGLVVMTPFYIEPNRQDPMRAMMDRYGATCRMLAAAHGAVFVDTQAAMDALTAHLYPAALAWDRVHPTPAGHMAIARAFLNAVGFEW